MSDKQFWILLDSKQLHICYRAEQSSCWWQIIVITAGGRMHPRHRQETLREPSRNTITDAAPVLLLPHTGNKVFKQSVVFRPLCSRIIVIMKTEIQIRFDAELFSFSLSEMEVWFRKRFPKSVVVVVEENPAGNVPPALPGTPRIHVPSLPQAGWWPYISEQRWKKDSETREKVTRWDPFPNNVYACCIFVMLKDCNKRKNVHVFFYLEPSSFVMQSRVKPAFLGAVALESMKIDECSAVSNAWKTSWTLCSHKPWIFTPIWDFCRGLTER